MTQQCQRLEALTGRDFTDDDLKTVADVLWGCYSLGFCEANLGIAMAAADLSKQATADVEAKLGTP